MLVEPLPRSENTFGVRRKLKKWSQTLSSGLVVLITTEFRRNVMLLRELRFLGDITMQCEGTVKLFGIQQFSGGQIVTRCRWSGSDGLFGDLIPYLESGSELGAVAGSVGRYD